MTYTTQTQTTFSTNTESTYDWKGKQWQVPLNFPVAQLFKVGTQLLQVQAGHGIGPTRQLTAPTVGA